MKETCFFRLLKEQDKEAGLLSAASAVRAANANGLSYHVAQDSFRMIPGAPFAYWVSDALKAKFQEFPPLEGNLATVRVGLQTSDDFRFIRTSWEVLPEKIGQSQADTLSGRPWVAFAKGGEFSPYYSDLHLLVNWAYGGAVVKAWADPLYGNSGWSRIIKSTDYYFRPGLTWPRRTDGLSFRILPAGCIFADKGPALFVPDDSPGELLFLAAVLNSRAALALVQTLLARAELAQSYEVGLIQSLPMPNGSEATRLRLASLALRILEFKRSPDTIVEISHVFVLPALLQRPGDTLKERLENWNAFVTTAAQEIESAQREIDELCYQLYEICAEDRASIDRELGTEARRLPHPIEAAEAGASLLSWMFGVTMGRFDLRLALGTRPIPELGDPFAPLPRRSPGMLPEDVAPADYPIALAEDGILLDDEGHEQDIVARVREVFHKLFGERAEAIEREALEMVRAKSLREYFSRTGKGGFWDDHVSRYSRSRRRAPIYWRLQSAHGRYSLWLYSHRIDDDTLHKLLGYRYIMSKVERVKREIEDLRPGGKKKPGISKAEDRRLEYLDDLLADLEDFHKRLTAVANRADETGKIVGYKPELDDGMVVAAAPLHEFISWPYQVRHDGRRMSELAMYWEQLAEGKYDWARTAMRYWPNRVTEKCRKDKSLALAHDLDEEFFPGLREQLSRQAPSEEAQEGQAEEADEQEEIEETE